MAGIVRLVASILCSQSLIMIQIVLNVILAFTHFWSVVITTFRRRDYPQMLHISLNTLLILLKGVIMSHNDVAYLVDRQLDHVVNWGTVAEMIQQMDESYGSLFVVGFEDLTAAMKKQVSGGGSA
jgi:hypothetical protein